VKINEILLLHHCHTDIGYTHPQPVIWELHRRFIDQALDLCEETSDWPNMSRLRWTCECTAPLVYWLDRASDHQIDRFRSLVQHGQLGAAALPFHPTPLCPLTELVRLLDDVPHLREQLGLPIRTAICHDVNGLPWPITQVFRDADVELLIMGINQVYGGYPMHRPMGFRWGGSDGHDLLVFNGEHYATFHRELDVHGGSLDALADSLNAYLRNRLPGNYPFDFAYMTATHPSFVDNNPPDITMAQLVRRWNDEERTPVIRYILPEDLLRKLQAGAPTLERHVGDWTDYWNFGCASDPTALRIHRTNRARLRGAELVSAVSQTTDAEEQNRLKEAATLSNLFEEHTWTASCSVSSPDDDRTWEQSHHKRHYIWQSKGLLSLVVRDQMERLAGNPIVGKISNGLLLLNTSSAGRDVIVRVPNSWLESEEAGGPASDEAGAQTDGRTAQWQHLTSTVYRIDYESEGLDDTNSTLIGPITLDPFSWRKLPSAELTAATVPDSLSAGKTYIESPHYRLDFDDKTGLVTGLFDKRLNRQVVDQRSHHSFFGYVQETVLEDGLDPDSQYRGREAFYEFDWAKVRANLPCYKPDWPRQHRAPNQLREFRTAVRPDGVSLYRRWEVPGAKCLKQSIVLPAHRRSVQLSATIDKDRNLTPESGFFTFPLDTKPWAAHYDTADLPVEFDKEQLKGTCRDWVTVGKWVSVNDAEMSVTLACPNAPMVQIGGFNFGRRNNNIDSSEPCLLLAWPFNNYWMTNFPAGHSERMNFHWELVSDASYDPVVSTLYADSVSVPVESHPILRCTESDCGHFIAVEGKGVVVLAVRTSSKDNELVIDLVNVGDKPQSARIKLSGRKLSQASPAASSGHGQTEVRVVDGIIETRVDSRAYQRLYCN
jgi:alpha-mannosidase